MPIAARTFRVFVSSTFEDLKEERNALQGEVFPKLRTLCEQHGARFQAIDLRWGVRDEAALDQQTMEICLREIRRCQATGVRPNFIVLLGDRYGWQPLPSRIPASEFDALMPHIGSGDAKALAEQWYRLDKNAVPSECCLQPRTGESVTPEAWNPAEQTLRQVLAQAARAAGLTETALIKYEASATHQEILAGLGETEADRRHVFGFFRRPNMETAGETDRRLEDLKSYLSARLPSNIVEFNPGDTVDLCNQVFARLRQVIEAEVKRFEDRPALDLEVEAHNRFAEERCRIFTGRQAVLDTIGDYIRGPERRPLVLRGESGSGKSAVMAKASQQYKGTGRVVRRFIGASPQSASGHALLTSLCRQISAGETPVDYAQLENAFKERLSLATPKQPLVLFIDALDQLAASDPARDMTWLARELPRHVKVIVSTTAGVGRLPEGLPVELAHMAQSEGRQALEEWLREAGRTLQPWQRDTVLAHFERCGLPLYLKLAAEESRLWKSYTPGVACTLGEGVAEVIDTLFDRLASNANHGPVLVERSLGYLAAARYGLTEDEILDVLTDDDAVWNDFDQRKHHEVSERRLPAVVWSRLSLDLEPYLTERAAPGGIVMTFYHRQLAQRVAGRFLSGAESQARHGHLARYFSAKPTWFDEGRRAPNARRAVELPFQQRRAGQWSQAEETLFDVQFLFAKAAAGMVLDLDTDYQTLLKESPDGTAERREALELTRGALRLSMHVVSPDPSQFASQMVGRLISHPGTPSQQQFTDQLKAAAPRPWLRPMTPCLTPPGGPLLRILRGHRGRVCCVHVSSDGRLCASGSDWPGKSVKVWELETGREVHSFDERRSDFQNDMTHVQSVLITPDGRRVLAGAYEIFTVRDLERGSTVRTQRLHTSYINGLAATPDSLTAITGSDDDTLKAHDIESGRQLWSVDTGLHVACLALSADGRFVISGADGSYASYSQSTVKIWDAVNGKETGSVAADKGVPCMAIAPDGQFLAAGSQQGDLRVWDLKTGAELGALRGHASRINGVCFAGRLVVTGSDDTTVKLWDLAERREVMTLKGHEDRVTCVAAASDGRTLISGSNDCTLRVWSIPSSLIAPTPHWEWNPISCMALTPDGKKILAGSYGQLALLDIATKTPILTLYGPMEWQSCVAAIPGGRYALSGNTTLRIWDLETQRVTRTLRGHESFISCVAISTDGRFAISGSCDQTLRVWKLRSGKTVRCIRGLPGSVYCVAMTPSGRYVVSGSDDKDLRSGPVNPGGIDSTLICWELASGKKVRSLGRYSKPVFCLAITPDGAKVISGSVEDALVIWDFESGSELGRLEGHTELVTCCAISPDGRWVIAGSRDNTLIVWELETRKRMATFMFESRVNECAFTPDGTTVVVGAGNVFAQLALEGFGPPVEIVPARGSPRLRPSVGEQIGLAIRRLRQRMPYLRRPNPRDDGNEISNFRPHTPNPKEVAQELAGIGRDLFEQIDDTRRYSQRI